MEDKTKLINAQRRAALYNIKASNAGFNDYFGRDLKKERELEIERQKIDAVLRDKKFNIKLVMPGERMIYYCKKHDVEYDERTGCYKCIKEVVRHENKTHN